MNNLNKTDEQKTWNPDSTFLPFMFNNKDSLSTLGSEETEKIEQFEQKLAKGILGSDSVNSAIKKMVEAALSVEFGEKLMSDKGAVNMVNTICHGIMGDTTLRKQALIIIDKLTGTPNKVDLINEKGKKAVFDEIRSQDGTIC